MTLLKTGFFSCLLAGLLGCTATPEVRITQRKTHQGNWYALFYPQDLAIRIATSRPRTDDSRYQLSVAAAYTDLQTNQPLDLLVANRSVRQAKATVGFLDGVLTSVGNTLTITQIAKGQSPTSAQLEAIRRQQGTLLLQELLVFQGKNLRPAGGSLFQRRALVEFASQQFAVVESVSDYLTLKQFGDDLLELGARNALYLDMGDWDEGWYKAGSRVVILGHRRTETARQSNWLVFAKPPAAPTQP